MQQQSEAPKALWVLPYIFFPPGARLKFCRCSHFPLLPCAWGGCMRNNPWRRDLVPQMPNHTPQHRPSLRTHTKPGCRSLSTEGRTDDDPLGLLRGPRRWRARVGTPVAPTCRRSCRRGRAPGQSSAPTATAGGREWAGHSPSRRGTRAQVPAAPQPHAGVRLSRLSLLRCSLFLPPALGFFLRKRGRRRPDPDVRGAAGRGRQGMPPYGLFLGLAASLAAEMGVQGLGAAMHGRAPA